MQPAVTTCWRNLMVYLFSLPEASTGPAEIQSRESTFSESGHCRVSLPNAGARRSNDRRRASRQTLNDADAGRHFGLGRHGARIIESSDQGNCDHRSSSVLITTRLDDLSAARSSHTARSIMVAVVNGCAES